MLKKLSVVCMSACLCGCSLFFTDYKAPDFPVVASYHDAYRFVGAPIEADYWKQFKDEHLNTLMESALKNNFDMRTAYVNVEKALINVDIVASDNHPTASASIGSTAKRALDYHDSTHKSSSGNFSLSYQLDLFGKLKAADEAAFANYQATAYDYLAMRLTVVESTAAAYWQYAYAKEAVAIGEQDLKDSQVRLALVQNKFSAGAADSLDVDDAHINHLKVQATLDTRRNNLKKARTALATMLGTTADHDFEIASLDTSVVPAFSLSVPSELLARRPDLMKDEATLRKAYANYNEAKMAFFPDFTLTAGITTGDTGSIGRFLANPVGALGSSVTFPFLNFNKLSKQKKSALKDIDLANIAFVADYVKAVQEVYDDISDVDYYQKSLMTYKHAYELAVRNYERYKVRYESGLVALTDFLTSADTMRNAKISYLEAKLNNLKSTMALMTAIGGDNDNRIDEIVKD